jgi:hypothetical protein
MDPHLLAPSTFPTPTGSGWPVATPVHPATAAAAATAPAPAAAAARGLNQRVCARLEGPLDFIKQYGQQPGLTCDPGGVGGGGGGSIFALSWKLGAGFFVGGVMAALSFCFSALPFPLSLSTSPFIAPHPIVSTTLTTLLRAGIRTLKTRAARSWARFKHKVSMGCA